jgi:hypothetical protein
MTYASTGNQRITGTSTVRFKLPDATYLTAGDSFKFNNNSTGIVSVYKADNATLVSDIPGGGLMDFLCMDNATTNGLWDYHAYMSNAATSGTTGTSLPGTLTTGVISNALGAVGAPSYSFTGDTDTGMWSSAADFVSFSTNGVLGLTLSAGATSPVVRVGKQINTPFSNAACLTLATGTGNSGRLATFCYDNANPPLHISVGQGSGIPSIMWGALEQTGVNNTQIYALASTTTAKISSDASVARAFTLQVAPAGTINTQITWTDAAVVTSAGAWTLGPADVQTTHTIHGVVDVNASATTTNAYVQFRHGGVAKGYIGSSSTVGGVLIVDNTDDYALCLVGVSTGGGKGILLSGNGGDTTHGSVGSTGAWTLGPTTGATGTTTLNDGVNGNLIFNGSTLSGFQNLNVATAGLRISGKANGNTTNAGGTVIEAASIDLYQQTTNTLGGKITFRTHDGSSVTDKGSVDKAGAWTLGAASTTPTHQLNTANASTVGAAGGASALPATPTGYITININGTDRKIPYYAT